MNIFLPEKSILESVKDLDDRRLNKQIIECQQIMEVAIGRSSGYKNHPVVKYYVDYPLFVGWYGMTCVVEYLTRFNKFHKCFDYFFQDYWEYVHYKEIPHFYCEGPISDPNHIRTTKNTVELFRNKLCKKWSSDKYAPKWTNREVPQWYKEYLNGNKK